MPSTQAGGLKKHFEYADNVELHVLRLFVSKAPRSHL